MTRRCSHVGCQTILSRYNSERECYLHALPRFGPNVHRALRLRRLEELQGKHPEDLRWTYRDRETWAS